MTAPTSSSCNSRATSACLTADPARLRARSPMVTGGRGRTVRGGSTAASVCAPNPRQGSVLRHPKDRPRGGPAGVRGTDAGPRIDPSIDPRVVGTNRVDVSLPSSTVHRKLLGCGWLVQQGGARESRRQRRRRKRARRQCRTVGPVPAGRAGAPALINYGLGGGYPTPSDPGPAQRGSRFFSGGNSPRTALVQDIALPAGAPPGTPRRRGQGPLRGHRLARWLRGPGGRRPALRGVPGRQGDPPRAERPRTGERGRTQATPGPVGAQGVRGRATRRPHRTRAARLHPQRQRHLQRRLRRRHHPHPAGHGGRADES